MKKRLYHLSVMKAISVFQLFFFLSLIGGGLSAQTTVIVGANSGANATTTYPCPLQDYYYGQRGQYLYNAATLSAAGIPSGAVITQIGWVTNATAITGHLQEGYSISLKNTTITGVTATTWETGLTAFYGPTNYVYPSGYAGNVIFNGTPFTYTGGGLLVEACGGISTGGFTSNPAVQWTTAVGYNASHQYRADVINGCGNATVTNSATITTRPRLIVTYTLPTACSGTPVGGTTTSTSTTVCSGASFTLSTTGSTSGTGLTYQWQSSPNGTTWTNITSATASTLTTTQTAATYYRRIITCTASSGTANSSALLVNMNTGGPCVCLAYGASSATSTGDEEILNVTFGTLNNTSTCTSLAGGAGSATAMYSNYAGVLSAPTVSGGATVPFSVTLGTCGGWYGVGMNIYIDYNQNGSFADAGELVYSNGSTVQGVNSGNITIPVTATSGTTRMRIVAVEGTVPGPTGTYTWGETEDYCITIAAPAPCAGTPNPGNTLATANPVCPSISTTLSLQNATTGTGITYQWQSSPTGVAGSYTNVAGANSFTYTTTVPSAMYYRCVVTCSAGPTSGTSNPILLTPDVIANCYCTNTNTTSTTYYISNVSTTGGVANINNTTGFSTNGYGNFTAQTASQLQGGTVNFSVTCGPAGYTYGIGIWIDYNQDGAFGAGENVYNSASYVNSATGTFTVPLTALGGNTRMRVVANYLATSPVACPGTAYTECEDYTFNVIAPPATPPTPTNITASPTCASGVTLTATGTPPAGVTWYWQGTNPSGTDNSAGANATTPLTVFSNATYYIRAYNTALALWSTASASYTVTTVPANAATSPAIVSSNGNPACVTTNISSPTAVAGDYWQTTAAGTSTASPATTPYNGVTTAGTYYIRSIDGSGCWSAPSSLTLSVLPTPPGTVSATQIITCGGQGTLSINSAYYNNFNTAALGNATLYGNASLTGTVLELTPNALSQNGAAIITDPNAINSNGMTIDFDLITLGVQGADGASYSFGDDVTIGLPANGECGSGTKLKLAFDAYTNGTNTPGVYLMYNCTTLSQAPTTPGVLAYSNNVSWCGGVTKHVTISIDNAGLATVSLGGTVLFSNIPLGAGYLSANKATWKHAFAARTGGVAQGHQIDNINITYGYLVSPLQYSFDNAATWGTSNITSAPVGTYNTWVRYASNPSCVFSAGSATINPFAITPGTTVSSVATPCSGSSFTLSLTGATTGAGVTYQWQSSPDGTTWSNIASATSATLTTTQTSTTYYQCLVTCSGLTGASSSLQLNLGSSCQCAVYGASNATLTGDEEILNVTFGTLNNSSTCTTTAPGAGSSNQLYSNYAGFLAAPSATAGSSVPFSVTLGTCGGWYGVGLNIYIDYNQNGSFADLGELVYSNTSAVNGVNSGSIVIPTTALPGNTRMRVVATEGTVPGPTGTYTWGETEDYCVNIAALPVDAAVTNITAPAPLCSGNTNATVSVLLTNTGTTTLANAAVSVTLTVSGANTGTYTLSNSGSLAYLTNQTLNFTGVNLSNAGTNNFSATLTYTGDMVAGNNTTTSTAVTQTGPAGVGASATPNVICSGGGGPIQLSSTAPVMSAVSNAYVFSAQTGVALSTLTAPINLIGANVDDGVSAVITMPFSFNFGGTNYTQFSVNSNGLLGFGATAIPNTWTNTIVGFTTYPIVMPYWDDLYTATNGVNYQVLGTAPNRKVCIQWEVTNCCTGGTPDKTFQCWLLEGSNVVQFVYGAGANVGSPSVGISSASGNFMSVTTTSNTSSTTTANDFNTAVPTSGTSYTFAPPSYTYAWTPTANMTGATTANPTVSTLAGATTYTVSITGINGCASTATASVSVSNISASISSQTNVSCFGGSNADVTVVATGGATPYTYQLGTGAFQGNGFFSGLAAGSYTITAKDANNCTYPVSVTITEPASALGGNISIQNVSCIGGTNGAITVSGNGGTSPYQYKIGTGAYGSSGTFSGLSAGSYTITIKDANNCTVSSTETVIEPTSGVTASASATPILCNGGGSTVTVSATGGTSPYTGTGTVAVTAGAYTYTVTDANGCSATTSITVTEPTLLTANIVGTNIACFGNSAGAADLTAAGGTGTLSYVWSNSATTEDLTNIGAGTYDVTVTDANSCTVTASVTITQPTAVSASETHVNNTCNVANGANNASIDLTAGGGTGTLGYAWSNSATTEDIANLAAGTYTVTVTDANACTATLSVTITEPSAMTLSETHVNNTCNVANGANNASIDLSVTNGAGTLGYAWSNSATSQDLTNIAAGSYSVNVTDADGCTASTSVTITEPSAMTLSETHVQNLCNAASGSNNASIDLSVTNGVPSLSYAWTGAGSYSTQDLTNIGAGTYDVLVTDADGCTASTSVTVTQPTAIVVSETHVNNTCNVANGANNASIDLTAGGGTGTLGYAWSNSATTEDIANLAAGTYTVTVTDANACTATLSVTITEPSAMTLSETHVNNTCNVANGANNASIDLSVTNGAGTLGYAWSNSATSQDLTNIAAGSYSVNVTDADGCTASTSVTITEPSAMTLSETHVQNLCNAASGSNNASIDLSVTNGIPSLSYAWTGAGSYSTQDLTNIGAGTYDVLVTDNTSCTATLSVTITQPTAIVVSETHVNNTCNVANGANNASIDLTAGGGTGTLGYAWSNSATTEDIANLAAGTYTVTVTDANACTATLSVTITQPSAMTLSETHVNNTCNVANGANNASIDLSVTNGAGTLGYVWSNSATSQDLTNIAAGSYSVSVTDVDGCTASTSITITEPSAMTLSETHIQNLCNAASGSNNASIDLSVTNGVPSLSYAWTGAGSYSTQDLTNIGAGTYNVLVTDNTSCTATLSVTITQPTAIVVSETHVNNTCNVANGANNASIDLTAGGGTGTLGYAWSNSATTEDIANLAAGTYTVTVTDANACTATLSVTITEPSAMTLSETHVNNTCNVANGANNASIDLSVTNGSGALSYGWSNSATSQDLTNIAAGSYSVNVTDADGCTASTSVTITQPSAMTLSETHIQNLCNAASGSNNASIDLSVTNGVPSLSYAWTGAGSYSTQDLTNIGAGTYNVLVTDNTSCTATLSVTITQPTAIVVSETHVNNTCNVANGANDASIDLTAGGGTGTLGYAWSNSATTEDIANLAAGTYTVTVTDANACTATLSVTITQPSAMTLSETHVNNTCNVANGANNASIDLSVTNGSGALSYGWSNSATSQDLTNIAAGSYSVNVTDADGCTASTSVTITEPSAMTLSETHIQNLCNAASGSNNASIDLSVTNGVPSLSYAWTGAGSYSTQDLTNIGAGTYNVLVTDADGCTASTSVTITQPTAIVVSETHVNNTCNVANGANNASIDLTAGGGTGTLGYAWSNSATTEDIANLAAGTYTVTVTDANACTATLSVTITQPSAMTLSETHINNTCNVANGANNASIDLSVTNGSGTLGYGWSNSATSQDLTNIAAGSYSVNVTDADGCTASTSVTITQPSAMTLSETHIQNLCNAASGSNNASIDLSVTNGVSSLSYAWTGAGSYSTQDLTNIGAGTYNVLVTDNTSCTASLSVTITQPTAIVVSETHVNNTCNVANGANNASIDLTAGGGTGTLGYAWSNSATTEDIANLAAGTYTVTVTDANACTATLSVTITQPSAMTLSETHVNNTCNVANGANNASIDLSVTNGSGALSYGWSNSATSQDLTNIAAGSYSVNVTDADGCTASTSVTITQPSAMTLSETHIQNLCNAASGSNNASIDLSVTNGVSSLSYAWTGAGSYSTQDLTNIGAGTYNVLVTDNTSCTATLSVTITQPTAIVVSETHVNNTCNVANGANNASIDLTAGGGTGTLGYAWSNSATTEDISSLAAGTYTVTVTDANACTATLSVTITQPSAIATTITPTNIVCFGYNTGAADLSVSGGTSPYSYAWSNSATTEDLSSVVAGVYDVTVTDAASCMATASVSITQPAIGATVNPVSNVSVCPGQNIVLNFSGSAIAGTIYEWTVSNTGVGLAANGNGNINVAAPIVSGSSQVATLTVTPNAGGCLGTPQTAQITVLPKPSNPVAGVTPYCSDATMWVSSPVSGTIKWYNNNTGAGTSIGIGATVPGFTSNGTYYAYEDLGGCMSDASNAVVVSVGMANHWNTIVNPTPPVTGTQVYYADAYCLDGSTGMKYYYNTAANMLLMASDYSIPAGVQLVTHTPTSAAEMAVKVDIMAGYGSGTGQFVSAPTAPYVTSQFGWYVMHRTWQIEVAPVNQIPVGDTVRVKYFFSALDEFDIFNSTGNVADSFRFYKLRSGLDPSNPSNHAGVDSSDIFIYDPSTIASLSTWVLGQDTVTGSKTADYYVSSFSGGGGGAGPGLNVSPLPVVLSSFKGENVGNENFLHWITEKELNTDHFDVERSDDKINYHKIGQVEANAQVNGGERNYDFIDKYPLVGSNHYRLKVVDKNGASNYSKSIELKYMPMKISFELYPNPMKDKLNVRIDGLPKDSKVRFTIYNLLGEKVFSDLWKEQGNIIKEVNVSNLAQGTYIYECVELKTGEVVKGKLTRTDL